MPLALSPVALCLPTDVIQFLGREASTEDEAAITLMINAFSAALEGPNFLDRKLQKGQYTEYFDGGDLVINLSAPPVSNLDLREDSTRVFDTTTQLVENEDYTLEPKTGLVRRLGQRFVAAPKAIRAVYDGGLVQHGTDPASLDVPHDLRMACAMQVAYWFSNRDRLGIVGIALDDIGSARLITPTQLLPAVREIIYQYRRYS